MNRQIGKGGYDRLADGCKLLLIVVLLLSFSLSNSVADDSTKVYRFDIKSQALISAISEFAEQADLTLVVPDQLVSGKTANRLIGYYTLQEGIETLLSDTGLVPAFSNSVVLKISAESQPGNNEENAGQDMGIKKAAGLLGILAGALTSGSALSASDSERNVDQASQIIEEIIVTARRREESAQEVPIPVTVLSEQSLKDRAAEDLRDLGRFTPNLSYRASGNDKNASVVFLRGIGQINVGPSGDPKVGLYQDNVYLARAQGGVFDFLDVNRVEVLRGPQGTLFGRNSTAGLVHVLSNRPVDEFDAMVTLGVGNDGQLLGQGMLNVPLAEDLAARLAVHHRESDGYVEETSRGNDWNDEDAQQARLSFRWTPNERFMGDLILDYQRVRELPNLGECEWTAPENGATATSFLPSMAYIWGIYDEVRDACNATDRYVSTDNDSPHVSEIDAWGATIDLSYDLGWAELKSITAYRDVEEISTSWGLALDAVGTPSYLDIVRNENEPNESDQFTQEIRLAGLALDGTLDWTIGAFYFREDAVNKSASRLFPNVAPPDCSEWPLFCFPSGIPGLPTLGDLAGIVALTGSRVQIFDAENKSSAVYGEVTWRFKENWSLTAGIRYTEDERKFTRTETMVSGFPDPTLSCPSGTPPVNGTTCQNEEDFDETTPRLILSWDLDETKMVYAGWSRGYSSGGFNADVRMRPYDTEISSNWEAGLKSTWLDNRVLFNLTAFFNEYENQQVVVSRVIEGNPSADLLNAQEAEIWGIEGEFRADLSNNWWIHATFGWMDGEYNKFIVEDNLIGGPPDFAESTVTRDISDSEFMLVSPYNYSVAIGKTHFLDDGGTLSGQVGWSYRGRSYNTVEALDSSRQDAYGLLDARFSWALAGDRTTISLWGSNLLDKEAYSYAIDLSGGVSPVGFITRYWDEPRRFGLELRHDF